MIVPGYTEEKEVVLANLSAQEIVDSGLDPWRLDLCDPHPVERVVDGRSLYFSKLKNIVFAYWRDSDQTVVGLFDGQDAECACGVLSIESERPVVGRLRCADRSFQSHWAEYLQLLDCDAMSFEFLDGTGNRGYHQRIATGEPSALLPRTHLAVRISDRLEFCDLAVISIQAAWSEPAYRFSLGFGGAMFDELPVSVKLPEPLMWVYESLNQVRPTIFGPSLRNLITDRPLGVIYVLVDWQVYTDSFEESLAAMDGVESVEPICYKSVAAGCKLLRNGCLYVILKGIQRPAFYVRQNCYSADALYCSQPGRVDGVRIAWHDLGSKRARRLISERTPASYLDPCHEELEAGLIDDGFKIVSYPKTSKVGKP